MTAEEWISSIKKIVADAEQSGFDAYHARHLLFGIWSLFIDAPTIVHHCFDGIESDDLRRQGKEFGPLLEAGSSLGLPDAPTLEQATCHAAFLLRALETIFIYAEAHLAPRRREDLMVEYNGAQGYLIPFKPRFRQDKDWPHYFPKRGLVSCRCIKAQLGTGQYVDIAFNVAAFDADELICGIELFDKITPLDAEGQAIDFSASNKFVFHGIAYAADPEIAARIKAACTDDICDILVFPELTMPPEQQSELADNLRMRPWDIDFSGPAPCLTLGGSWHIRREDGKYENCAPIYDGNGTCLGTHRKIFPYSHPNLREDITPSNAILVVVARSLTVAVAICLDFCQEGHPTNPYDELDVDLVIVASMGSETTLTSHEAKATTYWNNRKTGTIIGQQHEAKDYGYVAAMPNEGKFSDRIAQKTVRRKLKGKA